MKPIIFTGDSFTFGEGVELHDDRYREIVYKKCMQMKNLNKTGDDLGYRWHKWSDFSENILPAGKLRYELSYPALVSNYYDTLGFRKFWNGGSQSTAIGFINKCIEKFGKDEFSVAIINLTSPTRDESTYLFDFFKNTFDIDILDYRYDGKTIISFLNELFLKWEHSTDGKKTFTEEKYLFGHMTSQINGGIKFISLKDAQKLQDFFKNWDGWIEGITKLYYKKYTEQLDNLNIPYYFISHWNEMDAELLDKMDDSDIIKKIKNRTIPIYKNEKETSLSNEWDTDFYLNTLYPWCDNLHPSKYGHKIIADSIIRFINNSNEINN